MAKDTSAKPKEKKRGRVKGTIDELKKVSWPSFGQVVKQTGIVLAVVVVFLVVLMGFDALLGWLYQLLVEGLNADTGASLISSVGALFCGAGAPLWL